MVQYWTDATLQNHTQIFSPLIASHGHKIGKRASDQQISVCYAAMLNVMLREAAARCKCRLQFCEVKLAPIPAALRVTPFEVDPRYDWRVACTVSVPGFQRFLDLGELGPKSRAAETRPQPPPPVISAPALRERETSGNQGNCRTACRGLCCRFQAESFHHRLCKGSHKREPNVNLEQSSSFRFWYILKKQAQMICFFSDEIVSTIADKPPNMVTSHQATVSRTTYSL